ncbi:MAG: uncharacterized protein PWQ60_1204 [Thermoanaerobacteraceae bacterium]|nr:uncharacterized protein [Thermoanaerobacteraceae bacterium]
MNETMYLLVILTTFIATAVNTITGFGFSIIAVAVFSLGLPVHLSVSLSNMITLALNAILTGLRVRSIRWKYLAIPLAISLVIGFLCICFVGDLSTSLFKRFLGLFLIFLSLYFLFFSEQARIKPTVYNGVLMGALSGLFQGLFGMGGPPMVLYYFSCTGEKEEYMGTLQVHFFITNICMIAFRIYAGLVPVDCGYLFLVSLVPMLFAIRLGSKCFRMLSEETLHKVIYFFIMSCGVYYIVIG